MEKFEILFKSLNNKAPQTKDSREKINLIMERICIYTGWKYGECWTIREDDQNLEYYAAWYSDHRFAKYEKFSKICKFPKGIGFIGRVWLSGKPLILEEISYKEDFLREDTARATGFKKGFAFPLLTGAQKETVIAFFTTAPKPEDYEWFSFISEKLNVLNELLAD